MISFFKYTALYACVALFVSGCSSFNLNEDEHWSYEVSPTSSARTASAGTQSSADSVGLKKDRKAPEQQPAATIDPVFSNAVLNAPPPPLLPELTSAGSGGSVQIFSLDDGAPIESDLLNSATLNQTPEQSAGGAVSLAAGFDATQGFGGVNGFAVNDNVLVFPIDGLPGLPSVTDQHPAGGLTPFTPSSASGFVQIGSGFGGSESQTIFFNFGSARLGSLDLKKLDDVAAAYKAGQLKSISVEGHASVQSQVKDTTRRKIVNLKESVNRSYNVAKALMERGVPAEAIQLVAWGETRPPLNAGQRAREASARRVEIRSR